MARLYKVLGSLAIEENGRSSSLIRSPKRCALVCYLIIDNKQGKSREVLADILWESTSASQARERIRTLLKRVRKDVPELHVTRQTVNFQPQPDTTVDLYQLETVLAEQAKGTISVEALAEGLQLYTGDLLTAFYVEDAPQFNEWLLLERERLRRQVLEAYHDLCEACTHTQQWRLGIEAAHRWLALDNLDERAYRWLMILLSANGQVSDGLQVYEQCQQLLLDELGVEPEAATTEVVAQLMTLTNTVPSVPMPVTTADLSELTDGQLADVGALPPNSFVPHRRNPDFVGREAILKQLADILLLEAATTGVPVAAITGMRGLGKSQLAVEFAYRYGRFFPGGVFWLHFANPDQVAEEVALIGGERGMGLYLDADTRNLRDRVDRVQRVWQESSPRLLIFDNCEDEALLAEWLPVTGGCRVLLTSNRAVWAHELQVQALPLPLLTGAESVTLLQSLCPTLDREAAQEISTAVSHLPLALHLAGSFLMQYKRVSPQRYLQQLAQQGLWQHPSLQGRGTAYSPTGHELSLERTFALSLAKLQLDDEVDDTAQQLLLRAACFAPAEPIPQTLLLQTFLADSDDILAELAAEDGLMRLIALGFLILDEQEAVVMHGLVASFVQQALAEGIVMGRTAVITTLLRLLDNWLAEKNSLFELPLPSNHLQHITQQALADEHEQAGWLALCWGMHLNQQAEYVRANRYLVAAKARLTEPAAYAYSLHELGTVAHKQARWTEAQALLTEALQLRRQLEDKKGEGDTLNHLGQMFSKQGEFETAARYFQKALDMRRQVGDHYGEAACLNNLGLVANFQGNYAASITYFEQALSLRQKLGNPRWVAQTLNNLGIVFKAQGNYAAAETYLVQALTIFRRVGDRQMLALVLNNLGDMTIIQARFAEAQTYLTEALALYRQIGDPLGEVMAQMNVGWVAFHLQEMATAVSDLQAALKQARALGDPQLMGRTLSYLAHLFGYQMEVATAVAYGEEALAIARKIGDRQLEGEALHYLGDITLNAAMLHEALAIRQEIGARPEEARTWHYLGRLALQKSEWETAVPYFQHALSIHESLNLTHWHANDLAGLLTAFFMLGNKVELKHYYQQVKIHLQTNPSLSGIEHPEQVLQFIEAIGSTLENNR